MLLSALIVFLIIPVQPSESRRIEVEVFERSRGDRTGKFLNPHKDKRKTGFSLEPRNKDDLNTFLHLLVTSALKVAAEDEEYKSRTILGGALLCGNGHSLDSHGKCRNRHRIENKKNFSFHGLKALAEKKKKKENNEPNYIPIVSTNNSQTTPTTASSSFVPSTTISTSPPPPTISNFTTTGLPFETQNEFEKIDQDEITTQMPTSQLNEFNSNSIGSSESSLTSMYTTEPQESAEMQTVENLNNNSHFETDQNITENPELSLTTGSATTDGSILTMNGSDSSSLDKHKFGPGHLETEDDNPPPANGSANQWEAVLSGPAGIEAPDTATKVIDGGGIVFPSGATTGQEIENSFTEIIDESSAMVPVNGIDNVGINSETASLNLTQTIATNNAAESKGTITAEQPGKVSNFFLVEKKNNHISSSANNLTEGESVIIDASNSNYEYNNASSHQENIDKTSDKKEFQNASQQSHDVIDAEESEDESLMVFSTEDYSTSQPETTNQEEHPTSSQSSPNSEVVVIYPMTSMPKPSSVVDEGKEVFTTTEVPAVNEVQPNQVGLDSHTDVSIIYGVAEDQWPDKKVFYQTKESWQQHDNDTVNFLSAHAEENIELQEGAVYPSKDSVVRFPSDDEVNQAKDEDLTNAIEATKKMSFPNEVVSQSESMVHFEESKSDSTGEEEINLVIKVKNDSVAYEVKKLDKSNNNSTDIDLFFNNNATLTENSSNPGQLENPPNGPEAATQNLWSLLSNLSRYIMNSTIKKISLTMERLR